MNAIGIDLGGTNIKGALINREKGIVFQLSVATEAEKGKEHVLDRIAGVVKDIQLRFPDAQPCGIGIGAPGVISKDRKMVSNPPNLPGWKVVNLADEIKQRTGLHCRAENDANLAALGSSRFGIGKAHESFIMVTLGTGVGGGIIYERELYRGVTGGAAELGHVIIDYHGPESNSPARGGIEAYLGQRFLSRYAADLLRQNPDNPLYVQFKDRFDALEPIDLYHAANEGNAIARKVLHSAGEKLGYALVNYIHILDIRTIVLSGGVSRAGEWIIKPAREIALSRLLLPFHEGFDILYEPLGNDAALLGAASLAMETLE